MKNSEERIFDIFRNSLLKTFSSFDFKEILKNINKNLFESIELPYKKSIENRMIIMYQAKWFPLQDYVISIAISQELEYIIEHTRQSKNRVKKIDKSVFNYCNKSKLDEIKRRWSNSNIAGFKIKILKQTIQAYNRKEYALTVSTLATLWEGIILEKVHKSQKYRTSTKTRNFFTELIKSDKTYGKNIIIKFFEEYIWYDCKNMDDIKDDVPGRHPVAHSWYNSYPSKKMALNAILFTDFLINISELQTMEENNNGKNEDGKS